MSLVPASTLRTWMHATQDRFAYRCLPLLIANQAGWFILNSHVIRATWSGDADPRSLRIEFLTGLPPYPAVSHFGHGILTWNLPYLFRTPPRYNLLVRGPANWPKDGASPLEGIVETDWAVATFTVNWKLTRADFPVTFDVDEPIAMLVPQLRGELERFKPVIQEIEHEPEVNGGYQLWSWSRQQFLSTLVAPGPDPTETSWQKHYFQGTSPSGVRAREHQLKLKLRGFVDQTARRG